jgi:hypothetical protein
MRKSRQKLRMEECWSWVRRENMPTEEKDFFNFFFHF